MDGILGQNRRMTKNDSLSASTQGTAPDLLEVEFHLKDLDFSLVSEWDSAFADCAAVKASQGSILNEEADAIVSPANSFGYMDGGLDLVYSRHFGWEIERKVRDVILADYDGELPIGQAIVCSMDRETAPFFMISAPTMRVPMRVDETVNAFLAFRGVLRAVRRHHRDFPDAPIRSVLCPGLGTGEGRMAPDRCALQMRQAYEVVALRNPVRLGGLGGAARHHMMLLQQDFES